MLKYGGGNLKERLFSMQDMEYKKFHSSLMPTVNTDKVIGVRTPLLRKLVKELAEDEKTLFFQKLPHEYYEENNLHAFIICDIKDFDRCLEETKRFLPYIDNWATCDSLRPKAFKKNVQKLTPLIDLCLSSKHVYTVRYGIGLLLTYFLDGEFDKSHLERVAAIESDEYYINMMSAWYFATALAKKWEDTLPYITENLLPVWVHNKTIQKAIESFRITLEQKEYLKALKRKS